MNKDKVIELARQAGFAGYFDLGKDDRSTEVLHRFAAALTEPLEHQAKMWEGRFESMTAVASDYVQRIQELEAEIAHWHNAVIKEVAAQSIVPKVPLTDEQVMDIVDLQRVRVLMDEARVAYRVARAIEAAHGIGGKV